MAALFFFFVIAGPLEHIPTNSWIYDDIDYLKTYGLIKSVPAQSQPWTKKEAALLVKEALDCEVIPKPAKTFLYRLLRVLSEELKELGYSTQSQKNPWVRINLLDLTKKRVLSLENDWLGKIQIDTSNQSGTVGTIIKTGYDPRMAIYDRFEFTCFGESIPDVCDSAGSHVPGTRVHSWMNIATFQIEQAYLNFKLPWFIVQLGRDQLSFGPGKRKSVILADSAPALDMIQLKSNFRNLKLLGFTAALSRWGEKHRFLSGQRIELTLFSRIQLGGNMLVVHSPDSTQTKSFFGLVNPLIPLYFEEANSGHDDNFLVGWDITGYWLRAKVYSQLFLDNWEPLPSRAKKYPNAYCLKLGFYTVPIPLFDFSFEYNKVTPYTYYHRIFHIAYTHYDIPLGNPLGPDADETYLAISFYPLKYLFPSFELCFTRRGERNRGDFTKKAWLNEEQSPIPEKFPSGIVEKSLAFGPAITFKPWDDLNLIANGQYIKRSNPSGIDTLKARSNLAISICIQYRY